MLAYWRVSTSRQMDGIVLADGFFRFSVHTSYGAGGSRLSARNALLQLGTKREQEREATVRLGLRQHR